MTPPNQPTLRPHDVVVALALHVWRDEPWTFHDLGRALRLSAGEVHKATRRLADARLYGARQRRAQAGPLADFVEHGVRYAFPPVLIGRTVGLPTAHSAPVFHGVLATADGAEVVWPDLDGAVEGEGLVPLYPGVPTAARADRRLYELLAVTDALRIGGARERREAGRLLRTLLGLDAVDRT